MLVEEFEWNEEFAIGVPEIDKAHENFFRIVRRLSVASQQKKDNFEWAANEGIKFVKTYAVKHFDAEEEYMRSIDYVDLESHARQHEHMRTRIIPGIESVLRTHNYSNEAMQKFLRIMVLWFTRHILIYDKKIGWEKASPTVID